MIRCIPISSCVDCPYKQRHYSQDECSKMNFQPLPKLEVANGIVTSVPDWCPLPPHPSFAPQQREGQPAQAQQKDSNQ